MKLKTLAFAIVALSVAACSSSKKDSGFTAAHNVTYGGPTGAVTIASASQAATVAGSAYASLNGVSSVGGFTGVMGVEGAPAITPLAAARLAARFAPALAAAQVSGATQSGSDRCDVSGTMSGSITAQDLNNPFRYTGDSASITFSLCDNGGGEVIDGSISIHIDSTIAGTDPLGSNPATMPAGTYGVTIAFSDLTVTTPNGMWTGMDGSISLSVTKRTSPYPDYEESVSGAGLAYATGQGNQIFEGSLLAGPTATDAYLQKHTQRYTNSTFADELGEYSVINGKVCSVAMGGCLTVVTAVPVYDPSGSSHPTQGRLVMTSGNAELILDVLSATSVDVGFDTNVTDNAGTDPTPVTTLHFTWTCLDANNCQAN